MTIDDLKKLDRRLREVQDPIGSGLPAARKIFAKWAQERSLPIHDLAEQDIAWKWRK